MKMKNDQLKQFLMHALDRLPSDAATTLATGGGMLELDLQTFLCEF
jgi:hypothetical protein